MMWTQVELNYSLISANIPCIIPLVKILETRYGGVDQGSSNATDELTRLSNPRTQQQSQNGTYNFSLSVPSRKIGVTSQHGIANSKTPTSKEQKRDRNNSLGSDDSKGHIIRKDVSWEVTTADNWQT